MGHTSPTSSANHSRAVSWIDEPTIIEDEGEKVAEAQQSSSEASSPQSQSDFPQQSESPQSSEKRSTPPSSHVEDPSAAATPESRTAAAEGAQTAVAAAELPTTDAARPASPKARPASPSFWGRIKNVANGRRASTFQPEEDAIGTQQAGKDKGSLTKRLAHKASFGKKARGRAARD